MVESDSGPAVCVLSVVEEVPDWIDGLLVSVGNVDGTEEVESVRGSLDSVDDEEYGAPVVVASVDRSEVEGSYGIVSMAMVLPLVSTSIC